VSGFGTTLIRAETAMSAPAGWSQLGRLAAAMTLVLGAACQVVAFAVVPSYDDTAERLQWVSDHAARAQVGKVFDELAIPFLVGSAIVYLLLSRRRSPRLAWVGGILLTTGMVGLAMVQGAETISYGLADDDRFNPAELGAAIDDISTPSLILMLLLFLPGALFGLVITGIALWRSRAAPRGAVVLLYAFLLFDIALQQGLLAHVLALAAASWIAVTIMQSRIPS
jgi:hypothetical protein